MYLNVKTIVNGLFYATIRVETFEGTGVGQTKNEAIEKALYWLNREIKVACENYDDLDLQNVDTTLNPDKEFFDDVWLGVSEELKKVAIQVAEMALKSALSYGFKASMGGLFF